MIGGMGPSKAVYTSMRGLSGIERMKTTLNRDRSDIEASAGGATWNGSDEHKR